MLNKDWNICRGWGLYHIVFHATYLPEKLHLNIVSCILFTSVDTGLCF